MVLKRIVFFLALMAGLVASQLPEFAQQYRQRLGGAVDELNRMIAAFDADAARFGLGRQEGLERLAAQPDPLARERGERLKEDIDRARRLEAQLRGYAEAGPLRRLLLLASDYEPEVARRAAEHFEPAVPVTSEGLFAALAGFAGGWTLGRLAIALLRRRRQKHVSA